MAQLGVDAEQEAGLGQSSGVEVFALPAGEVDLPHRLGTRSGTALLPWHGGRAGRGFGHRFGRGLGYELGRGGHAAGQPCTVLRLPSAPPHLLAALLFLQLGDRPVMGLLVGRGGGNVLRRGPHAGPGVLVGVQPVR